MLYSRLLRLFQLYNLYNLYNESQKVVAKSSRLVVIMVGPEVREEGLRKVGELFLPGVRRMQGMRLLEWHQEK